MNNDHKPAMENRAEAMAGERIVCENCSERVVFLMKDKDHEFSVGLTMVLQCLEFAVRNGDLPKLPSSWVGAVERAYDVQFEDEAWYNDFQTIQKERKE